MLKRSPSLVEQVKTHLKQRITRAEFDSGRLPSEADLASELNVSRNTVRDALSRLEMEGVIFRRQGAGTFVNQAGTMVKTRLEQIIPYETLIQEHGFTPSIQIISVVEKPPDPPICAQLNLAPDEKVLIVQKLFLADAEPIIFTVTAIPTSLIKRPYVPEDFRMPIFQFLPQFCQQELAYYLSEIVPLSAPAWLIDRLDLSQSNSVILSFEELGHNSAHEPLITAISYFRNDLLRLRLIRRYRE